ncbi:DHHC palmitoyltransferase-domain-containing protein [Dissophora ornata]|nr:DHHC palmitoyltransferase-domain-containing protein [Dissophora ornata]
MRVAYTRTGKPVPFLLTIFPVVFFFLLIGFGYYAFVVTLCVRLLRIDKVALGVVLLVIYHITFVLMLWAYAMVILTDPGRVTAEHQPVPQPRTQEQQQVLDESLVPGQGVMPERQQTHQSLEYPVEPHIQQVQQAHMKGGSVTSLGSGGVMIPGAQSTNRSGYIHITEDPTAQGHPLWCSKCQHVKPERAHHCRVCKRCVLKMDHHCPWVLNCVGQDNYKFFVLFVFYTTIHSLYILATLIPLYMRFPDDTWTHQFQVVAMVISGIFGFTLVAFTITHIRLILLNRTTIEDHSTPLEEGPVPCLRKGWFQSEGDKNQGNERLFDLGFKENWQQAMGKGWKCLIPVRFPRPEEPIYNEKVVARQWRDYNHQVEMQRQQLQQGSQGEFVLGQPGMPHEESTAIGTERSSLPDHEVHQQANYGTTS